MFKALVALILAGTGVSLADTVSAAPGSTFQNLGASGVTPFFVNPSLDAAPGGLPLDLGNFLQGTGGFAGDPRSPGSSYNDLSLLAKNNPSDAPGDYFFNSTGSMYRVTLLLALTGNSLEFGWYDASEAGSPQVHALVTTATADGTSVNFQPTATFGFYVRYLNTSGWGAGWTAYTETSRNNYFGGSYGIPQGPEGPGHQHFALLHDDALGGSHYLMGVEDAFYQSACAGMPGGGYCGKEGYGDFQDLVLRIDQVGGGTDSDIPEPGTVTMLIGGLGAMGLLRRKLQRAEQGRLAQQRLREAIDGFRDDRLSSGGRMDAVTLHQTGNRRDVDE